MITGKYPSLRLRRNRKYSWSRKLIQENTLSPSDFILPIFLIDGSNKKESITSIIFSDRSFNKCFIALRAFFEFLIEIENIDEHYAWQ